MRLLTETLGSRRWNAFCALRTPSRHWRRSAAGAMIGLSLTIAAVSAGCDGGGGGSSVGSIPTSVPGNKRLSDLTPAERGQYCADLTAWAMSGPLLTAGCNVDAWIAAYLQSMVDTAASDADLRATCSGSYAQCVANGVTTTCDTSMPSTCTATVSEYDACVVESINALAAVPSCSSVTRGALAPTINSIGSQAVSPMCMEIAARCPAMM